MMMMIADALCLQTNPHRNVRVLEPLRPQCVLISCCSSACREIRRAQALTAMAKGHVVIVDNFDSYTHNLVDLVFKVTGQAPLVIRNDDSQGYTRVLQSEAGVSCVIISPGPGHPGRDDDIGICRSIIAEAKMPVLGVCLGFQGMGLAFGMPVSARRNCPISCNFREPPASCGASSY